MPSEQAVRITITCWLKVSHNASMKGRIQLMVTNQAFHTTMNWKRMIGVVPKSVFFFFFIWPMTSLYSHSNTVGLQWLESSEWFMRFLDWTEMTWWASELWNLMNTALERRATASLTSGTEPCDTVCNGQYWAINENTEKRKHHVQRNIVRSK